MRNKFITLLLIISLITPFFYLPYQAKKAQAILGVGDLVIDIKALAERIIDGVAMALAQKMIDRMVQSTVKWAQSGFEGNPAYVTDPKQFFGEVGDGVAGQFIQGSDLGFLCSPFQTQVRLALRSSYVESNPFQCTLTDVVGNIEDFYNDFGQGGWDAWFSMTQNPSNNPYGAYLTAKVELDSRIASAVGLKQQQLNWDQGFLSWSECEQVNPSADPYTDENGVTWNHRPDYVPGRAEGECIKRGPTKTPGSVIQSQLNEALPSGLKKLQVAQHVDQLISAFTVGLLQRYVFGPKGLFNGSNYTGENAGPIFNPPPGGGDVPSASIDIDGDGIPDGLDTDGDGIPDICYFGGSEGVMGPPCLGSVEEIDNSTHGGGSPSGGGQCTATGNQYEGELSSAINAVLSANPGGIADKPNLEDANGFKENGKEFMNFVAAELQSSGFNATAEVLNGNNNPNKGEDIALWESGDTNMERYATLQGGGTNPATARTIRDSISIDFTGFVPLACTPSGGSRECGCRTGGGGTTPTYPYPTPGTNPNPTSGVPFISSVNPSTAVAGQTTITVTGDNLTTTVQFFDGNGGRNTVVGSVNAAKTQVTVLVPGDLPAGNATVKIYRDANTVSNGKLIQVSGAGESGPTITKTEKLLGRGTFPDVAFYNNRIWVAVQQSGNINLYNFAPDLTDQQVKQFPFPAGQAFTRLTVSNNILWLAYRYGDNSSGIPESVKLWRSDTDATEDLGGGFGNQPVALGSGFVAWQKQDASGAWKVVRRALSGGPITTVRDALATGISRVLANGSVRMMDEDRNNVPGYFDPSYAGTLTVAVGPSGGIIGFFNNNIANKFNIWNNLQYFNPHTSFNDATSYAVTMWSPASSGDDNVHVAIIEAQ